MNLVMPRLVYTPLSTLGRILVNHEPFCYTLEDTVRPKGIKISGQTAIPAGRYKIIMYDSPHFKRMVPMLIGVPNRSNIEIHGGNDVDDTDGCILAAYNLISAQRIYNTAADDITKMLIASKEDHYIEIIDTYPYVGSQL